MGAAQPARQDVIHWAYSAYFGTGTYRVGDTGEVYNVAVKPRWQFRRAALEPDGRRQIGVALRLPLAVGVHDVVRSDPLTNARASNIGTVSVVPGIELEVPLTRRLRIKPFAFFGYGARMQSSASAWIYWSGVKSEWVIRDESTRWALVNALTYVGYTPNAGSSAHVLPVLTALESSRPLAGVRFAEQQAHLHWHIAYTHYVDELAFNLADTNAPPLDIDHEWELGIAFSKGEPMGLWRLRLDRIGIAYRFGSSGDFNGVGLTFKSLFDR